MKKAEEIKKGLTICQVKSEGKKLVVCDPDECPYGPQSLKCKSELHEDAYSYIEQLEADKEHLGLLRAADAEAYRHKLHELEALVPRWISVEDRRPEANDDVLVFVQHPISGHCWTQIAHRLSAMALDESDEYDEWWLDGSGETVRYITHWMPLPEPPEVTKP